MSYNLSAETFNELRGIFDMFDLNCDNEISPKELRLMMRAAGVEPTEAELNDLMRIVDLDGNGAVDFQEFISFMVPRLRDIESDENLEQAFETFNRSGFGFFDAHDLRIVMSHYGEFLTEEECNMLIADMDTKNEQRIHLTEFMSYMRRSVPSDVNYSTNS